MAKAVNVVFKQLTPSDFYWINQPGLTFGGGQSYIDFDTSDISANDWAAFFKGCPKDTGASGPYWTFSVHNIGPGTVQKNVKIGQRRATSFSIRSQKLPEHSQGGRRLHAWSPHYSDFPAIPAGLTSAEQVPFPLIDELRIFIIRDDAGEFWAGWTRVPPPDLNDARLLSLFKRKSGLIHLAGDYEIDPSNPHWPFAGRPKAAEAPTETAVHEPNPSPFAPPADGAGAGSVPDDDSLWDPHDELEMAEPGIAYSKQKIRKRNQAAAKAVRKLYANCQISGDAFIFNTTKGKPYLEVHHLIPLGKGGADSPHNMIVVSAHVHKMLHHADVYPVDLAQLSNNQLQITINGQPAVITWHPQHAAVVFAHNQP